MFWIVILVLAALVFLLSLRELWSIRRLQRQMRADNEQFHRLIDPMLTYFATLGGVQPYSEADFRQFLREQYGEDFAERYLVELHLTPVLHMYCVGKGKGKKHDHDYGNCQMDD